MVSYRGKVTTRTVSTKVFGLVTNKTRELIND
jgi:hypothetical protein